MYVERSLVPLLIAPTQAKSGSVRGPLSERSQSLQLGTPTVQVKKIGQDDSEFQQRYDPSNPAANAQGYVKLPNVNSLVEVMDMHEAERSYNANLAVMQSARGMLTRTIELLK